jgi:hypothetical protein
MSLACWSLEEKLLHSDLRLVILRTTVLAIDGSRCRDEFSAVNIVIEMSLPIYDGFIDRRDPASKEYATEKQLHYPPAESRSL